MARKSSDLAGRRVLITGAARGIGAALAHRLHKRGVRLALLGIEPDILQRVSAECGNAPWRYCDVGNRAQVDAAVDALVGELGGLDVLVANAGIAKQLPLIGGDPTVMEQTLQVNTLGVYYCVHAAGPHLAHENGYVLLTSSLAAEINLPLVGAYSASKAAVKAIGNTLRQELRHTGAEVGIAYFAELDTDMTSRGFGTEAARQFLGGRPLSGPAPLEPAIDALEHAITRRERQVVAPRWVGAVLRVRGIAQRVVELRLRAAVPEALRIARSEDPPFTTEQPVAQRLDAIVMR